jgi:hypothetical protein
MEENNKIIAEFMGVNNITSNILRRAMLNNLEYHSDWNCLMEVIEKIESLKLDNGYQLYDFNITSLHTTIIDNFDGDVLIYIERSKELHNSKLNIVYEAVIEFINFYNKQKEE